MKVESGLRAGFISMILVAALSASAAIWYGEEAYPAGAVSLKPMVFSGAIPAPQLVLSESGVQLKLNATGGACGVVRRLGSFQREGEYAHVSTRISNPTSSFVAVGFQLYNATEKRILVETAPVVIRNSKSPAVNLGLEYRASRQDVGDNLVLCWVQVSTEHPDRTFCIEQTEVVGIRPLTVAETFPGGEPARLEPAVFSGEAGFPTLAPSTKDADNRDGLGDGAVAVTSTELGGTYGAIWKLGKVVQPNFSLHLETVWFPAGSSFVKVDFQLYNATRETVLASSGEIISKNIDEPAVVVALDYALQSSDKGCELELRWVQTSTEHASRNFIIDRVIVSETK